MWQGWYYWYSRVSIDPRKENHLTENLAIDLADHIDDVIGDRAISLHTRGTEGTLDYEEWNSCNQCGRTGESQPEIQHDTNCPVGWFQDLVDDVRNPKLKETK